jgi:hypothetical protein
MKTELYFSGLVSTKSPLRAAFSRVIKLYCIKIKVETTKIKEDKKSTQGIVMLNFVYPELL